VRNNLEMMNYDASNKCFDRPNKMENNELEVLLNENLTQILKKLVG